MCFCCVYLPERPWPLIQTCSSSECDWSCNACRGPLRTDCLQCMEGFVLQDGLCSPGCSAGFYQDGDGCFGQSNSLTSAQLRLLASPNLLLIKAVNQQQQSFPRDGFIKIWTSMKVSLNCLRNQREAKTDTGLTRTSGHVWKRQMWRKDALKYNKQLKFDWTANKANRS